MAEILYLTIEKLIELIKSDTPLNSIRHPDVEAKYQARDKKKDIVNKEDDSLELLPSEYPYYWQPHVRHWILWYHGKWEDLEENHDIILTEYPDIKSGRHGEYLFSWINPPHLRSVKSVPHCHVLFRPYFSDKVAKLNEFTDEEFVRELEARLSKRTVDINSKGWIGVSKKNGTGKFYEFNRNRILFGDRPRGVYMKKIFAREAMKRKDKKK